MEGVKNVVKYSHVQKNVQNKNKYTDFKKYSKVQVHKKLLSYSDLSKCNLLCFYICDMLSGLHYKDRY